MHGPTQLSTSLKHMMQTANPVLLVVEIYCTSTDLLAAPWRQGNVKMLFFLLRRHNHNHLPPFHFGELFNNRDVFQILFYPL